MVNTREGRRSSYCAATPHPALTCLPVPALLPKFSHHPPTGDATGKRDPRSWMAVSMDTISIVTIWGEGGGGC